MFCFLIFLLSIAGVGATDVWKEKKAPFDNVDELFDKVVPKGHENPEYHFPGSSSLPGLFNLLKMPEHLLNKLNKGRNNRIVYNRPAFVKPRESLLSSFVRNENEMIDDMTGNMDVKPPSSIDDDDDKELKEGSMPVGECKIYGSASPVYRPKNPETPMVPKPILPFRKSDSGIAESTAINGVDSEQPQILETASNKQSEDDLRNYDDHNFDEFDKNVFFLKKNEMAPIEKKFIIKNPMLQKNVIQKPTVLKTKPYKPLIPKKSNQARKPITYKLAVKEPIVEKYFKPIISPPKPTKTKMSTRITSRTSRKQFNMASRPLKDTILKDSKTTQGKVNTLPKRATAKPTESSTAAFSAQKSKAIQSTSAKKDTKPINTGKSKTVHPMTMKQVVKNNIPNTTTFGKQVKTSPTNLVRTYDKSLSYSQKTVS